MLIGNLSIHIDVSADFGKRENGAANMVEVTSTALQEAISTAMGLKITDTWLTYAGEDFSLLCTCLRRPGVFAGGRKIGCLSAGFQESKDA